MSVTGRMIAAAAAAALVLAAGCAGGAQPAPGSAAESADHHAQSTTQPAAQPEPPAQPVQPAQAQEKVISARITAGKVDGVPARVEVDRGTRVSIDVTSDRRDELHIHGYEKTVPLPAGSPAVVQFVADVAGVFEVETHDSELLLFQLVVRE